MRLRLIKNDGLNWIKQTGLLGFLVMMTGISVSDAEHLAVLSDEEIWQIEHTPISAEQEALIDDVVAKVIYDGVAPKSERKVAGGAFGIRFGQTSSDHDSETNFALSAPHPHELLTEYTVKITPITHQAYRIGGRAFFADQAACLAAYKQLTAELKSAYSNSLVLYDNPSGDLLLHTADAEIEASCGYWNGQQALSVSYTAEQLRPLVRVENQVGRDQRNQNLQPLAERQALAPFLGIRWDVPFDAGKQYPDNTAVFHSITPPEPDPRFSHYEMRRDNFSSQPMHIVAETIMTDLATCMSQVKAIEESWQQQYPSSAWQRALSMEHYEARITARDGSLVSACRQIGKGQYRLSMVAYKHDDEDEGWLSWRLGYDAARLLSGQRPIFFSHIAVHDSEYSRVQQIAEQYRQLQAGK